MSEYEDFVKTLKSGDYERAFRKCKCDLSLRGLEVLQRYCKTKNDLYLELYGIELGYGKFEIQDILNTYNDCECQRCGKRYSPKEQDYGEVVCDDCYEILTKG